MDNSQTLLERLGGISFIAILLNSLYDELLESPELERFFRRSPIETIKTHQSVLFRMILGSDEGMPSHDKLINYILATHSRLFRQDGLNETHFDLVAGCLVSTLHSFQVGQGLVKEIVSVILPFRAVFEYGAKIAADENRMEDGEKKNLPLCSAMTMGTDILSVLPNPPLTEVPLWLQEEMKQINRKKSLRDWTSILSDRCSATGDILLADVMMDIPISQLESYLVNVLQLAFLPDSIDENSTERIIKIVRHPRGFGKDPLSRQLFDRLVVEFGKACEDMNIGPGIKKDLVEKLRSFRKSFPKSNTLPVNGVTNPSPMLVETSPELILNTLSDNTICMNDSEKIEQKKRFSLSSKAPLSEIDRHHSRISINTPKRKNGVIKWFGMRTASVGTKVTI